MKKFTFFVLLVCFSSAVNAQSSKSLGLNISYFSSNANDLDWIKTQSPQLGLTYNYFINEKHGIITELGVSQTKALWMTLSMCPTFIPIKDYNLNYSLHYIFKHNQFFIKSGFNAQIFSLVTASGGITDIPEEFQGGEDPIFFQQKKVDIDIEHMEVVPEFHLALGRDFDLGKINIRVNGFVERAFLLDDYIDFGLSAGVFYQFGK